MSEDGSNKVVPAIVLGIMGLILVIALVLAGGNSSATHRARKEFGKIYRANDGRYYTRGHDRGGFSDWEYVDAGGGDSSGSFSGGSWSRVSSTPSGMTATSKVVEEEGGKPTNEVEEESAEPGNEEIPKRPLKARPTAWIRPVIAAAIQARTVATVEVVMAVTAGAGAISGGSPSRIGMMAVLVTETSGFALATWARTKPERPGSVSSTNLFRAIKRARRLHRPDRQHGQDLRSRPCFGVDADGGDDDVKLENAAIGNVDDNLEVKSNSTSDASMVKVKKSVLDNACGKGNVCYLVLDPEPGFEGNSH